MKFKLMLPLVALSLCSLSSLAVAESKPGVGYDVMKCAPVIITFKNKTQKEFQLDNFEITAGVPKDWRNVEKLPANSTQQMLFSGDRVGKVGGKFVYRSVGGAPKMEYHLGFGGAEGGDQPCTFTDHKQGLTATVTSSGGLCVDARDIGRSPRSATLTVILTDPIS